MELDDSKGFLTHPVTHTVWVQDECLLLGVRGQKYKDRDVYSGASGWESE